MESLMSQILEAHPEICPDHIDKVLRWVGFSDADIHQLSTYMEIEGETYPVQEKVFEYNIEHGVWQKIPD